MTVNVSNPADLQDLTVVGAGGEKLGKVDQVYLDNQTGQPEWVSVKTGFFGNNTALVPTSSAEVSGDTLSVPFTKDQVKGAPHNDPGHEISEADEQELYSYYGISYGGGTVGTDTGYVDSGAGYADSTDTRVVSGEDVAPTATGTVDRDGSLTRSEERLHVGTEQVEAGRARLRKYVTQETVTQTVPVTREELVVEREPITDANAAGVISDIGEEEHSVILHEERPVVVKETVPVERVKLGTNVVTEQATVSEEVRKENIEVDDADGLERKTQR